MSAAYVPSMVQAQMGCPQFPSSLLHAVVLSRASILKILKKKTKSYLCTTLKLAAIICPPKLGSVGSGCFSGRRVAVPASLQVAVFMCSAVVRVGEGYRESGEDYALCTATAYVCFTLIELSTLTMMGCLLSLNGHPFIIWLENSCN